MEGRWETQYVCPKGSFLEEAGLSFHLSCHAALGKNEKNHGFIKRQNRWSPLPHPQTCPLSIPDTVLAMDTLFRRPSGPPEDMSHPKFLGTYSSSELAGSIPNTKPSLPSFFFVSWYPKFPTINPSNIVLSTSFMALCKAGGIQAPGSKPNSATDWLVALIWTNNLPEPHPRNGHTNTYHERV